MSTVVKVIKLLVPAAKAKPSPQIGQALGALGINMMKFCKEFNARTLHFKDDIPLRVRLTARSDQSYSFTIAMPQSTWFLKKAANIDICAHKPGIEEPVGSVHVKQIYEIAKYKQTDSVLMQGQPLEGICRSLVSTMKSMGLRVDASTEADLAAQAAERKRVALAAAAEAEKAAYEGAVKDKDEPETPSSAAKAATPAPANAANAAAAPKKK